VAALAESRTPEAEKLIGGLLDDWIAGKLAPEVQLEVSEAAKKRPGLAENSSSGRHRSEGDDLADYRMSLAGGDPDRGRRFFASISPRNVSSATNARAATALWARTFPKSARKGTAPTFSRASSIPTNASPKATRSSCSTSPTQPTVAGRLLSEANGEIKVETVNGTGKPETVKCPQRM